MNRRTFLACTTGLAALAAPRWAREVVWAQTPAPADIILRGATVCDGSGGPPFAAEVALQGGRIAAVGPGLTTTGADVIDLQGLVLAPGFIDIHSHTDLVLLANPRAESKVRQGVTTEVVGQNGSSIGTWTDREFESTKDFYRSRYDVEIDFRGLAGFFDRLARTPGSVNLASMIGAGSVRGFVVGDDDRSATPEELKRMVSLIHEGLAVGACGVSSGLEYEPGGFADPEELIALTEPLRARRLPYASHIRNEDDRLIAAIEEALNVGRLAGVPVQVSHMKAQGQRNWWKARVVLEILEAARADRIDVMYDRYPYVAYSTGLSNLFPLWVRDGGIDAFLERLLDSRLEAKIEQAVLAKVSQLGDWNSVQVTSTRSEAVTWARGRRFDDLAVERGEAPYVLLKRIMIEDRGGTGMVGFGMDEENTERLLAHPLGMVCSDSGARAPYGPLSEGSPHPRSYGTFPRLLGHYCRERQVMPLETAIHKITSMPAARLNFLDRGVIRPGAIADLTVFDPDIVADQATFENPHQYPTGILHVIVGGAFVIKAGEHTGATPGRVVKPDPVAV